MRDLRERLERRAVERADVILTAKLNQLVGENVRHREAELDLVRKYQSSRIVFIAPPAQLKAWEAFEVSLLERSGLKGIALSSDPRRGFLDVDMVVYHYQPAEGGDRQLGKLLDTLRERRQALPLIVYAPQPVDPADRVRLQDYPWFVLANMPITLLTHIHNVAHLFHATNGGLPKS